MITKKRLAQIIGLITLVLLLLHFTYVSIISNWNAFYTPSTESLKNIPEEFEYCHKSAEFNGNFPIRDIDTNEIIHNNRGFFNLLPVTHMMYIEGSVERKSITYRKWSYFIPLGTLEFPCGQLGWP